MGHNDLQPVVVSRYPEVARHLEWLDAIRRGADDRFRRLRVCIDSGRKRQRAKCCASCRNDAGFCGAGSRQASTGRLLRLSSTQLLGSRQVVRHRILIPTFVGSIPTSPARFKRTAAGGGCFCCCVGPAKSPETRVSIRQPDGVHRQCQSAARRRCGAPSEYSSRPRHGRSLLRWRSDGRNSGERARQGRVRAAVDLHADQRHPDGSDGDGGCAEARLGRPHHRGDSLFRLCAPGPPHPLGAGGDHRQGGGQHAAGRGRRPPADHGSALGPDPGFLRHPGRQHLFQPDPAGRYLEAQPSRT